jgi:uncharacterized membrane protein YfcA
VLWADAFAGSGAMTFSELTVAILLLSVAAFTQGVFGLGFAMIAMPLLALFLDLRSAVVLVALPAFVPSLYWLVVNRRKLAGSDVPLTVIPAIVIGAAAGVWLQISIDERTALRLLAGLLLLSIALPWILDRWGSGRPALSLRSAPGFAAIAGVTESALNVGAPFIILHAGASRMTRQQLLITLNLCFLVGKAVQLTLMAALGVVDVPVGLATAIVAVCLAAYALGNMLGGRWSEQAYRRGLTVFLAAMVVALVLRAQ